MEPNKPRDRNPGNDPELPSEDRGREAQDRAKPTGRHGGAESPIDSMHIDSPTKQKNTRGHRQS